MPASKPITTGVLKVSEDGYLRLTWAELQAVTLNHLISGMDDPISGPSNGHSNTFTTFTGYTEWISDGSPSITLGWDWKMRSNRLYRVNKPRTNLMLLNDSNKIDIGQEKTLWLLENYINSYNWNDPTMAYLNLLVSRS